ncbi:signal peptide containing protein [Theileria equi strain WA]|uniref:Signal peptide containing protein n=1 Tax=Theileria equi strain WA TaxID=1537102 RepID=L1LDH2_THEEQ|nr:signal peptide containing protein [Theileria equi strain WA]EKX73218.1 signal peptide containing protein [Theileria equi strain WA]|eukprot:XP_004832670.1 signal peptide containing protein [Theileria equi strain WA]
MNAIVALISAVSVFAVSALHLDFTGDLAAHGALTKGLHHGAHALHFAANGEFDGLKCGANFEWALPEGKFLKELLAFSHCKHDGLLLFHLTFTDGTEGFFHFHGGLVEELAHHVWFGKLAKGVCKHAPALAGLPHHAVLADLAHVLA